MTHAGALGSSGLCRAHVQVAVDLARVGGENFGVEVVGQFQGEG